jgi:hypothetical protein
VVCIGCAGSTEPAPGSVPNGLYVLATIDQHPLPQVTERQDSGDSLSTLRVVAFDSIRIVNDTLFERSTSDTFYVQRSGQSPLVESAYTISLSGLVLPRDGEIVLSYSPIYGPVPAPQRFAIRPEGLIQRIEVTRFRCSGSPICTIVSDRFVDALYTRR